MANPFVAEIRIVGFNFAPTGWALCDGQLLPISQNTALFSLLGTQYGGDGKSNFALPNLQGMAALHTDQFSGPGQFPIGAIGGTDTVTLLQTEMPSHQHATVQVSSVAAKTNVANSASTLGATGRGAPPAYSPGTGTTGSTSPLTTSLTGSSAAHNNLMPYLVMNYVIALQGVYPPRS